MVDAEKAWETAETRGFRERCFSIRSVGVKAVLGFQTGACRGVEALWPLGVVEKKVLTFTTQACNVEKDAYAAFHVIAFDTRVTVCGADTRKRANCIYFHTTVLCKSFYYCFYLLQDY